MTHDEMIAVIAAQQACLPIEAKRKDWKPTDSFEWLPVFGSFGGFAFDRFIYRIKPEPP